MSNVSFAQGGAGGKDGGGILGALGGILPIGGVPAFGGGGATGNPYVFSAAPA